jgi:NADH:ubiquinone oxidoreductase subunit E
MNTSRISNEFNEFLRKEQLLDKRDSIDRILNDYRGVRGGLIPVLQQVQEEVRYLPPMVQDYIAFGLGVPSADVFGVVSFYSFFSMKPRGRHLVRVCLGTACYVKGAPRIVDKIETGLDIRLGDTTSDRRLTIQAVRCLGACGLAPIVMVDEDTLGHVDPLKIIKLLDPYE